MDVKVEWTVGIDENQLFYIDRNTLIYISGQYVCFQNDETGKTLMHLPSYAANKLIVHPIDQVFALAETEKLNPSIFIYNYPSLELLSTINGVSQLEILHISFSQASYLAIISGLPDFTLSVWNFKDQTLLCKKVLDFNEITAMSMSPVNWRHIIVISVSTIFLYTVENCGALYKINETYVKLPTVDTLMGSDVNARILDSRTTVTRSESRIQYDFELPPSAIAGVSNEHFKEFLESQDVDNRCKCESHSWSGIGDLFFGCEQGQIIKLELEDMKFKMLYNSDSTSSNTMRIGTPISNLNTIDLAGNVKQMCFSKEGLYFGGTDGVLRLLKQIDNEVSDRLEDIHQMKGPISQLCFNYTYTQLAIASEYGTIDILSANENIEPPKTLMDINFGPFVGVGVLPNNKHVATLRQNGIVQIWDTETQIPVSEITLSSKASSLGVSPLWNIIGVGMENGILSIIDVNDVNKLRLIHEIALHKTPISKLQFDKRGQVIVTGSDDGNVVVVSGLVSELFKVLGMATFEGSLMDLCVFNNPTSDDLAQVAVLSQGSPEIIGGNKLVYFEISSAIINDPTTFYANINGMFDEDAIRKMNLNFESPVYGCVLGTQPPEEKSPCLYAIDATNRCLSKYQIPSQPPKKIQDINKEEIMRIIQVNRINIPGLTSAGADSLSPLPTDIFSLDTDIEPSRTERSSIRLDGTFLNRRSSSNSQRKSSLVGNIDWKAITKIKAKLTQHDVLPDKFQNQLKLLDKIEELNRAGNKASYLKSIYTFGVMHEDPNASLRSSFNSKILITFGIDGFIRLMDLTNENNVCGIAVHQVKFNGVHEAVISYDGSRVLSCGADGIISCHKIILPNGIMNQNEDDYNNTISKFERKIIQENSQLSSYKIVGPDSKSKNQVRSRSSTTSFTPSFTEKQTWSDLRVVEHQAEEDLQYHELKENIKEGVTAVRKIIQEMFEENEHLSDLERIDRQEFELDLETKSKMKADIENEVQKVRDEIELENLSRQYMHDIIKKECWDQMSVKGRSLCAFLTNIEVTNFPMKDRPQKILDEIDTVIKRRMIEIEDFRDRKRFTENLTKNSLRNFSSSKDTAISNLSPEEVEEVDEDDGKESMALFDYDEKIAPNVKYLYPQMDIETKEQRIYQIILLKDIIYQIKVAFNKEFEEVYKKKEQEINRIKEKNARINKILVDIDMPSLIQPDPELSNLEKPEKLLIVDDSEIKVEKYLTDEQKRKLEEDLLAEEERKRREKLDNWRERGLEDMMGGVLEVKREDELKKDIPKPAFVIAGKPSEEWTDEEKKIYEEYEKKVKELNEEREKYKKQLEAEYKKLATIIEDAKTTFDEALLNLFNRQINTQMSVYQEEVKILRIQWSLLIDEELTARRKEILELKSINRIDTANIKVLIAESKSLYEKAQDEYDSIVAEEKLMDKAFRKEFSDIHGPIYDHICKLYKRRPRNKMIGTQIIPCTQMPNYAKFNPYLTRPTSEKQKMYQLELLKNAINELNKQDANDTIDSSLYERLCKARQSRIEKELKIKHKANELAEMLYFCQRRIEEEKNLENTEIQLQNLLKTLNTYSNEFYLNKEIQLIMKQGQVEVISIPGYIHDYTESVLLHRSLIEDLNKEIKVLGTNKVKHMNKAKESKKKFIHLEWELKKMLMEYQDLVTKMREIQCFKVTKEIQRYLTTNDYDSLINAEIIKMEQTIANLKQHHSKNIDQKKTRLKYISDRKLNKIKGENVDLNDQLTELNVQVYERKHVNAGFPGEKVGQVNMEKRYQKILQRQHLVDLAKSQAREVAVLRSEVERLRMRTFPALVQHK